MKAEEKPIVETIDEKLPFSLASDLIKASIIRAIDAQHIPGHHKRYQEKTTN